MSSQKIVVITDSDESFKIVKDFIKLQEISISRLKQYKTSDFSYKKLKDAYRIYISNDELVQPHEHEFEIRYQGVPTPLNLKIFFQSIEK